MRLETGIHELSGLGEVPMPIQPSGSSRLTSIAAPEVATFAGALAGAG